MVFSSVGFDNNVAQALKRNRDSNETDEEICSMIESRIKQFRRHDNKGDQSKASLPDIDESFTLGRRLIIEPNKAVEPEVLLSLKQLQESDEETAQILLTRRPNHPSAKTAEFNQYSAMYRCAVRALIEEDTNVLTRSLGCAPPAIGFSQDAVNLLEQFFEVCQRPNEAEIALLARVGTTSTANVTGWFNQKRELMKPLFVANAISGGNGPVAKHLRRERLGQGERGTKKKPLTRH